MYGYDHIYGYPTTTTTTTTTTTLLNNMGCILCSIIMGTWQKSKSIGEWVIGVNI